MKINKSVISFSLTLSAFCVSIIASPASAQLSATPSKIVASSVAPKGPVSIVLEQNLVVVAPDGKENLVAMLPTTQVKPGDVIEYKAIYKNNSANQISNMAATLPVPQGVFLLTQGMNTSKLSARATLTQSGADSETNNLNVTQDNKVWGTFPIKEKVRTQTTPPTTVEKDIPLTYYKAVRWTATQFAPNAQLVLTARMKVIPNGPEGEKITQEEALFSQSRVK